jgi:hypothetical protein
MINADGVDTSFLSHSYYASCPEILLDIMLMLHFDFPPEKRIPPLACRTVVHGHAHWSFVSIRAVPTSEATASAVTR